MTSFRSGEAEPITSKAQLIAVLSKGAKPKDQWRIGTEHEKFVYLRKDYSAVPYEGPSGIKAFLTGLMRFGWEAVNEGDTLIALKQSGKGTISLEPGGQLELSGAQLDNVHQTCGEIAEHMAQVRTVGEELGVGLLGLGFTPTWRREDISWMPKGRYRIMREYMPKVGTMGLDMMLRTCTVQVNMDYASEADMVKKVRVALALQPVATALWANSPFTEGKPNGFQSFRANIWHHTDPARTGMIPFVFDDGMGYERYVDYALDVPMYFVYRDRYIDASGQSFRDFLQGKLPALPGELPTVADWVDHMSTAFPEVRIKSYIEMRGADTGSPARLCALGAFWVGLLYDSAALDAAWDIVKDWTAAERAGLHADVPRAALAAKIRGRSVLDIARQVLGLADGGLRRRRRINDAGNDETRFLAPLHEIAASGITPAARMLENFATTWGGDISKVYAAHSY